MEKTIQISLKNHAMSDQAKQNSPVSKSGSNGVLDPKSLTLDQGGKVLVEHFEGFDSPAELTFECVNGFVHSAEYEDLQYLCLNLVSELEKERKKHETKKV